MIGVLSRRLKDYVKRRYYDFLYWGVDLYSIRFNQKNVINRLIKGDVSQGSRDTLCIFAHYDCFNVVDDYVVYYLTQIYSIGAEIIFVTTCSDLAESEIKKIKGICSLIIIRKNVGIDFGSWKTGLSCAGDIGSYKRIIIANDSVYGPFFDIGKIINEMDGRGLDIWGITDSWEFCWHLQSYFIVFNQRVITSTFFKDFWENEVRYLRKKLLVIKNYELGLSQRALREGFVLSSYCEYRKVISKSLKKYRKLPFYNILTEKPLNPSHFLWKPLIQDFGCPFLKVELMRDNPVRLPDLYDVEDVLQWSEYDPSLIINHLKRVKNNIQEMPMW
ncbi:MAG: rhamnan synthesis F family protein [Thermodesulfovibrionales bacterium]